MTIGSMWLYRGERCRVVDCGIDRVRMKVNELIIERESKPGEAISCLSDKTGVFPDLEYELIQ